jgi:hypothetical protein
MSIRFIASATFVGIAGVVAISAHSYTGQSSSAPAAQELPFVSQMCDGRTAQSTADSRHLDHLAAVLGLSAEQRISVERISGDACAAMIKYHNEMLSELTPDQHTKLAALHAQPRVASSFHRLMMKVHTAATR